MHDTTIQIVDIRALPVTEGEEAVVLAMVEATQVQTPFADPNGQQVILTIPTAVYKVPMSKTAAQELINSLIEEVEKLPDPKKPSGIVVPGSPADVDRVAENLRQFGAR